MMGEEEGETEKQHRFTKARLNKLRMKVKKVRA